MKLELSKSSVNDTLQRVRFMKDQIKVATEDTILELVKEGIKVGNTYNASAPQSGVEPSVVIGEPTGDGTTGYVSLYGPNAVYDEFGTGEEGSNHPHPQKGDFPLNPYNSGPTIFYNQFANAHQWRYRPMAGRPYFTKDGLTQGIPAGKQMYNTAQYLQSVKGYIARKNFNNALKIFNK